MIDTRAVSPALAVAVLALAVVIGGLAAFSGGLGGRAMPVLRTFAIVAASSIALVHLLPEAIEGAGFATLLAAAAGALVPALLERAFHRGHDSTHDAPAAALAMGYAAVVVHQASEGAALASLARTGALSIAIVLAIAAHTVPLAMVVAVRVNEVRRARGAGGGAVWFALAGIALATALGAGAGSLVDRARLAAMQPWILAAAAGLLLHALGHDVFDRAPAGLGQRLRDGIASCVGVGVALVGLEAGAWSGGLATNLRIAGAALLAVGIVAKVALPGRAHAHAHHHRDHDHDHDDGRAGGPSRD